jgi:hypothetical protein
MLSIHTFISPMYLSYVTTFFLQFTTVTLNLSPINIYIIVHVTTPLYPSILQLYHYMPFPTCASSFCSSRVHLRHVTSSPKHHLTGQPHAQAPTHHGAANPQQQQPELSFQQLQQYLADVVSKIMDENKKRSSC